MKYLFNHTEENPLIINDYPYGFRLRTQIKYWIETAPKKGDRFCSQTLNPKTGHWNAPKKSTYYCIGIMLENEIGHIKLHALSMFDGDKAKTFIEKIGGAEKLNKEQLKMYNQLIGNNVPQEDEFTGKIKKDYKVKWEKNKSGECDEVKITFDRPDGVKIQEVYEAMHGLNQDKLNEVFTVRSYGILGNYAGKVRICVRGGFQLCTVSEDSYKEWLASDRNQ